MKSLGNLLLKSILFLVALVIAALVRVFVLAFSIGVHALFFYILGKSPMGEWILNATAQLGMEITNLWEIGALVGLVYGLFLTPIVQNLEEISKKLTRPSDPLRELLSKISK